MLMSNELQKMIPPLLFRLKRCDETDVEVVTHFVRNFYASTDATSQDSVFYSPLLYYLIVFSELWETPSPSVAQMQGRFRSASIATHGQASLVPMYCVFAREKSAACNDLGHGNYAVHGIVYDRGEYRNKSAKIPDQASVLLLSSKLDTQTPHKYAEYLLEALDGEEKELVTFEYTTHGALVWARLDSGEPCGARYLHRT
ncbi:unnamed protein product [Phytophthora lilii]|uniref:Unnamed protein product n=1 Tax=Phytophthora lilii TaxID=2077276 RepID=A0A9W6TQL2_9STRA|nr:unnamed protein product [Phytophthora lilii]